MLENKKEQYDLVVKSVVTIRKMVLKISDNKSHIVELHEGILEGLEEAGKQIAPQKDLADLWISEKKDIITSTSFLINLLDKLDEKFKNKDVSGLTEIWEQGKNDAVIIQSKFTEMKKLGEVIFSNENLKAWHLIWRRISDNANEILDIGETISLKLSMIEKMAPQEIDELTKDIVKHIPLNYSLEEAHKYEEDYLQAYEELKSEATKKKNLWDKFMDVLAGGIKETPAHRVMMRRWMEGDSK